MRTISILQHGRPELLESCVNSLIDCQNLANFDRLILSIDPGHAKQQECYEASKAAAKALEDYGIIECSVLTAPKHMGLVKHPITVLHHCFETLGTELHVQLEDDALLKADGLRLALWFQQNSKYEQDALLMSMCNHRAFGKGQQNKIPEDDPSILVESPYITSPFAWALNAENWPTVEKYWGMKRCAPTAWSFSLSMGMRMRRMVGLHPALSRCANVGRDGGVHETPETFDASQVGLKYQEIPYAGEYKVRARLDREDLKMYDDWMVSELEALKS